MENPVTVDSDGQRVFLVFAVSKQFRSLLPVQSWRETWKKKSFFLSQLPRDVLFPPRKLNVAIILQTMWVHSLPESSSLNWAHHGKTTQEIPDDSSSVGSSLHPLHCQPFTVCSLAHWHCWECSPQISNPTSLNKRRYISCWNTFVFCSRAELSV